VDGAEAVTAAVVAAATVVGGADGWARERDGPSEWDGPDEWDGPSEWDDPWPEPQLALPPPLPPSCP
jgi:hypothetical protein